VNPKRSRSLSVWGSTLGEPSAILAIEQIAHRSSPSFVRFFLILAFVGAHALLRFGVTVFGFAAGRAAVGKARLTRLQLELLRADGADFDRKCHATIMIQPANNQFLMSADVSVRWQTADQPV
jgi:hypothetical protein